ncbi:efflux RND transporter permease subunit [Novosphingobium album (ex Liu et al. 2023)]|uniref:Efflux RND transporter permease subunit n=1 Tax=Novosphingobium album (ex Liu et al. 2023) TaxID=3031130 RepID=A0ABT5WUR5_9SPHN|nr:efflux RND transporter permease subunit [Novosphingobium album (ex Liu et al. 2023)]MDE8653603.1 efflux RND transporter permease subunit [Novosphingobium album (ex Liu et al. 2023)]
MFLSDISVRRPIVAVVMALLLTIAGVIGYLQLSVREFPATDPPVISIQTTYTGASASVIESRITQPLEDRLAGIEGIETIASQSSDGRSSITVEFRPGRDIDAAANDVRDRVAAGAADRPDDAQPPQVRKTDTDAQPIIYFFVSAPAWDRIKLGEYVERTLVDRLASLDGVADVTTIGLARPAMRIWLDPGRLAAFRLTPRDIENALRSQNVELPAGRIESVQQNLSLRVNRGFTTPADFRTLVIGRGPDGYLVRLGDVARIQEEAENPYSRFHFNGEDGVGLAVVRQSGANTLAVAQAAKAEVREMAKTLPEGMVIRQGSDNSLYIEEAIKGVWHTLAEAAVLVTVVIFLFLGSWRATLIPAITVPICLLTTCSVLWLLGYSINLLTLLALVLAIGLVVDDAIVVLENVHRRIEEGEPPLLAAFNGAREVGFAVLVTTLVVCAVFVPVMFLSGETGLMFREPAVTLVVAVGISGFLALTLAPMLCSRLLREHEPSRLSHAIDRLFDKVMAGYAASLDVAMRRWPVVLAGVAAILGFAAWQFTGLESELAPPEDMGVLSVRLTAPEGTGFAQLSRYMVEAENLVIPMIGKDAVRGLNARIPANQGESEDFDSANMTIYLNQWDEREKSSQDVVGELNRKLGTLAGLRGNASVRSPIGRSRGQPITFVIAGTSYDELARARDRILDAAAANPGIVNLDADYIETKPQLLIEVDRKRAGDLGISVDDISQALQTLMGSRRVSTYVRDGEEFRVIVQADEANRSREDQLSSVYVRARGGALVPLTNVISVRESATAKELGRFNKMRAITLQGGLAPGYSLGNALAFLEDQARQSPEVLAVGYRGESQAFKQTGNSIWLVFGLAVLIIYLLLAAQFESFIHPAIIISAVPLAVAGGIIGLALTDMTINLYSQIGTVMLVGLAAKNGVLIIEFANQLRDQGRSVEEALREAAVLRLRPILMTSLATVAGAVPLAMATGAGAGSRASIGVVIVFGVTLATGVTLYIVPLLYRWLAPYTTSPQATSRLLRTLMRRKPQPAPVPAPASTGVAHGGPAADPAE